MPHDQDDYFRDDKIWLAWTGEVRSEGDSGRWKWSVEPDLHSGSDSVRIY